MNAITPDDETYDAAGELFYQGRYIEAREKYLTLAEAGSEDAQVALGWLYQEGLGVTRDLTEAYKWYKKVADTNAPKGQFYLGALHRLQKNHEKAVQYFEKAAMQGYVDAYLQLGWMYREGLGVPRDLEEAYKWYKKAADTNSSEGLFNIGGIYTRQKKYEKALEYYEKAAAQGHVYAQLHIGWIYQKGIGVPSDLTEAHKWYKKVADTNFPEGQFYLGALYSYQKNYKMALEYYEKAAAQDYIPAIYRLGLAYQSGEGVESNRTQAFEHFGRAADRGHIFAKKKIAIDMLKGNHGIANIPMGFFKYVWLIKDIVKIVSNDPESDLLQW